MIVEDSAPPGAHTVGGSARAATPPARPEGGEALSRTAIEELGV
ncbi:hypothetical protein [Amycolatopsis iheyensis]|nr:hypothetical protein [Amycolatopsis iheyensis]